MTDPAVSYCGVAPSPGELLWRWNMDPVLLSLLAAMAFLASRLPDGRRGPAFGATGTLLLVFVSPLCAASVALFSARAVHHLLLIGVAAPLLARALPGSRGPGGATAFCLATIVLWAWHIPSLYDAALGSSPLYWLMQASLLGTGWLYWRAVFQSDAPGAIAGIVAGAAQMGLLGAILTFAPQPLYVSHLFTTAAFALGPLADQQLAGLVMWVPGLIPYAVVAALILGRGWRVIARA